MPCSIPGDIKMEKLCQSGIVYLTLFSYQSEPSCSNSQRQFIVMLMWLSTLRQNYWALREELSNPLWFSECGVMDFLNIFFIKINCCLSTYQNNWGEGEISTLVTFRFDKKTAALGLCFCTQANNGSAVTGMVLWHSDLHFPLLIFL